MFVGLISSIVFSLMVVVRWWYYIDVYSVNILFWDQWDFYTPLFDTTNLWEIFRWQHGPHRQGVGLILTKAVASLSGWNTRAEAFVIGGVVCLAMAAALALRARLGPRLCWSDAVIPLIFLTPLQYELFAGTPNLSHGAMPLLLLMLYCLAWEACHRLIRYAAILTLNFLLIYTGFGVFVGMITPCLFSGEAIHAYRKRDRKGLCLALFGVAVSLLSAGAFFVGYHFDPFVAGFQFPIRQWWRYSEFMALMLANFCGIKGVTMLSYLIGFIILFFMSALALINAGRALRKRMAATEPSSETIIAVLTVFTLIFCANTAIGRISLGMTAAQSSRYVTYMIPGFLAIYLYFVDLSPAALRRLLLAFTLAGCIVASFPLRKSDVNTLKWYAEGKSRWKAAYLHTEDIEAATRTASFPIHPATEGTRLKQKLEYLKKEKLNLYLDSPSPRLNP